MGGHEMGEGRSDVGPQGRTCSPPPHSWVLAAPEARKKLAVPRDECGWIQFVSLLHTDTKRLHAGCSWVVLTPWEATTFVQREM